MDENKKHVNSGLLIMFEGIDGVGKTTQLTLVEQALQQNNWLVKISRSPGGTPIGEALRTALLQPLPRPPMTDLYIAAAVQEALIESINDKRASGSIMLHDRGPLSIAAYQIYGGGIDPTIGWSHVARGMDQLKPDLVIIYECDPEVALNRAHQKSRDLDYFESKPISYFQKVAEGFREAAKRYPAVIVDATQPIDEVQTQTMQHIDQLLASKRPS
jgi:dTMP kinase